MSNKYNYCNNPKFVATDIKNITVIPNEIYTIEIVFSLLINSRIVENAITLIPQR